MYSYSLQMNDKKIKPHICESILGNVKLIFNLRDDGTSLRSFAVPFHRLNYISQVYVV